MFTLTRESDGLINTKKFYQNVVYKMDGNSVSDFPPIIGSGAIVLNSITDYWRTTVIISVEKISDNEYNFITKNSKYNIKSFVD